MRLLPVLLAAGASSRFAADDSVPGHAKLAAQDSHGTPLLRLSWQALEQMRAQASQIYPKLELLPLLTILGGHKEQLQALLPPHASCCFNPLWQQGLGHSIALAAGQAKACSADALLLALADQVALNSADYLELLECWLGSQLSSSAFYRDAPGAPAIFNATDFNALCQLQGDRGAKALLTEKLQQQRLGRIVLHRAAIDIDTGADLRRLNQHKE